MSEERPVRVIFIHHSTGANILREGRVRELLATRARHVQLWDQGYDAVGARALLAPFQPYYFGLRDPSGRRVSPSLHIPDNNTDPDGLAQLFHQPVHGALDNALSRILGFDVIAFKSCFPVTAIRSDEQLKQYMGYYSAIRGVIDGYPNRLFIPFTPPPLRSSATTPDQALRAREFATWLVSEGFQAGRLNIAVFDLFSALADPTTHMLRQEYCRPRESDSHPNMKANREIGALWVEYLIGQLLPTPRVQFSGLAGSSASATY